MIFSAALAAGVAAALGVTAFAAGVPSTCPAWVPDPTGTTTTTSTSPPSTQVPTVTVGTTLVGSSSALVTASLAGSSEPAQVTVVYWQTGATVSCSPVQTAAASMKLPVSGLQPATDYQVEVVANSGIGSGVSPVATVVTLPNGTVAQGVAAGSTRLGRLTRAVARDRLAQATNVPLHFTYNGALWQATPAQLGARFLVGRTLATALAAQPGTTLAAPAIRIDGAKLRAYVAGLGRRYRRQAASASVRLVGKHAVVTTPQAGAALQRSTLVASIQHELLHGTRTRLALPMARTPAAATPLVKAVVVRLGSQTLTAYVNGKPVLTTPVTTGRPALPTPIGSFSVQFKASPYVFHSPWAPGSAYWYPPAPVTWAMEFYDGDFLHDDPAEPDSAFGSDSQNGYFASHGCVHVPHDAMAFLYGWLPVGAPVIVSQD